MKKQDVHMINRNSLNDLAFAHWQFNANEKAYENNLITKIMYEFAKEEICKSIDLLERLCYSIANKVGDSNGFVENKTAT